MAQPSKPIYLPNSERIWQGLQFLLLVNLFILAAFNDLFPDSIIWLDTVDLKTLFAGMVFMQVVATALFYLRMPYDSVGQSQHFKRIFMAHFVLLVCGALGYYLTYELTFDFKIVVIVVTVGYFFLGYVAPLLYLLSPLLQRMTAFANALFGWK